jgi:hypothetical protein
MRISPPVILGMLILGGAVAACTGNSSPPVTQTAPTDTTGQPVSLASAQSIQGFSVGSYQGGIVYTSGSGSITAIVSASPPAGLVALMSASRSKEAGTATPSPSPSPNTPLFYITYTGSGTATGLPGVSLTLPSAPAPGAAYYEATWSGKQWYSVGGAGAIANTDVTFNPGTTPIALSSSAPIYVSVYSGAKIVLPTPTPTPTPVPTPTPIGAPVYADGDFENTSSTPAPAGAPIGSTGWTQCTINALTAGITYSGGINGTGVYTAATAPPVSTYTASPQTTPAAVIVSNGNSAPAGTYSPTPTQTAAPAYQGSYVAQFGGLFNNYNPSNFAYDGLCQTVTIADPLGASITAYVFESGNSASKYLEDLVGTVTETNVTPTKPEPLAYTLTLNSILYMENIETSTVSTDTAYREIGPISLPTGTTTLFLGQWTSEGSTTNSRYSSYWWVDNFTITNK